MKKRIVVMLLVTLLCSPFISAQILKGHVYDAETHEPLIGASVTYKLKDTQGVVTDADGAYEIHLPSGDVNVVFSYVGFEDEQLPLIMHKGEVKKRDIYMKESTTLLGDVVVSAGRFEQKLSDMTVSMDLIKAADIARQAPTDITSTLQTIPGVDIVDKQPSIRGGGGWTYSVGARSLVLVDGMSVLSPQNGVINWNTVPLENVQQVEVIKGASSVLYGSSALNGIINIRTARPGLTPQTHISAYMGIYGEPSNSGYQWSSKSYWEADKYPVKPLMRHVFSSMSNPMYDGFDITHSRRIGNFDLSGGLNLFSDEGYREQGYNKRIHFNGNLTYHQPNMGTKVLNYGVNVDFLHNKYGDFFIWRSPTEPFRPSPFTNMGRESDEFHIDPFLNFTNPDNGTSHKVKARIYHTTSKIVNPTEAATFGEIMQNMGTDQQVIQNIAGGDYTALNPLINGALSWLGTDQLSDLVDGAFGTLGQIFPNATTADYCDLISYIMNKGIPSDLGSYLGVTLPDNVNAALSGIGGSDMYKEAAKRDKYTDYYLDYQFGKEWSGGARVTAGLTYEHIHTYSGDMDESHNSDNVAAYMQYDQRFWDRLSVSAGMRAEYYRIDRHYRETETQVLGTKIPFRPVFRAGLNYQLADYSFLRASFGQGYRNPSIVEKYLHKDVGGVGVFPNHEVKPEKGTNVEVGIKQGYKVGNLMGFADLAVFYTQYKDMVEFQFGLFNNADLTMINSIPDAIQMIKDGSGFGIGAQFHNVSKAQIYGVEFSTNGAYIFNKNAKLTYTLGYVYTEPRDTDYKKRNALENTYTDPLQMKEKSNESKYLKYRPKHSFKATLDFSYRRISIGTNINWKSKILAVDYIMLDEREKSDLDLLDYVRGILFGYSDGVSMKSYWKDHNTSYTTVDARFGIKFSKEINFQFMINNLFNKEYSYRPMAIGAPRTFVVKMNVDF